MRHQTDTNGHVSSPLFVFDADCAICSKTTRWLKQRTGYAVLYSNADPATLRYVGETPELAQQVAIFFEPGEKTRYGSDAIARALGKSYKRRWRFASCAMQIPPLAWLSRAVYRSVAANRYRILGESCSIGKGSAVSRYEAESDCVQPYSAAHRLCKTIRRPD